MVWLSFVILNQIDGKAAGADDELNLKLQQSDAAMQLQKLFSSDAKLSAFHESKLLTHAVA